MNKVFKLRDTPYHNLRHTLQFSTDPVHSLYNGTESASYLGPEIGGKYLLKLNMRNLLMVLKEKSKN